MNPYMEFLQTEVWPYLGSDARKPLRQQWRETRQLWARYRCLPYHYLKHRLYERSARADFLDYVPAKLIKRFRSDHTPQSIVRMTEDKLETVRVLSAAGIRCVDTLFSIRPDGTILQGDRVIGPHTAAEVLRGQGALFVKPTDAGRGEGAFKIDAAQADTRWVESQRNVLIQPVLRNHPVIAALNPRALNTVRVATWVEEGRCTLIAAFLRVAQGNSVVDNGAQGGISIGIDLTTGALNHSGVTEAKFMRRLYATHPDTGVRFGSVTLPWWRETLALAERAALGLRPHITLGLDIAITPDGPVFVEANEGGDFFLLQEACGPLAKSLLGQRVIAHWLSTAESRMKRSSPDTAGRARTD